LQSIVDIAKELHLDIPNFVWDQPEFIQKQIERGECFFLEDGGEPVGVIALRERKNGIHIESLVVKKSHTAKGYGTKLIEFAKEFAKDRGHKSLHAYTFREYNILDFYLKRGFTLQEYSGSYNGRPYYCLEMKVGK